MNKSHFYQLIVEAQKGDREALLVIIEQFQPLIKKACWSRDIHEQADTQQDIIERMIKAIRSYDLNFSTPLQSYISDLILNEDQSE